MINKNISVVIAKRYGSTTSSNSKLRKSESKNNTFEDNETNDNVKGKPQHNRCVRPIHNNEYEE